jgi:hypothetical protein
MLGACSSDSGGTGSLRSGSSFLARPDWVSFSGSKDEFTLRSVTPADLVGPEGQCAGVEPTPSAEAAPSQTGIALQMTECEVVRRAGAPDHVEVTSEAGQRVAILTYSRGVRPGVYRFSGGRLYAIERAAEPAQPARPPRPGKKAGGA